MSARFHQLDAAAAGQLFGAATQHAPTALERIPGARLLWLNRRVMREDPAWASAGGTEAAYRRHLLASCAWSVAPQGAAAGTLAGIADRYGGEGIGHNGGSARAVVIGGYHVKGVGQTPLLGQGTNREHATGGAYLEECVRETIFGEIAAAEFPHGAIATLAIIDTGMTQVWATAQGPKPERRCLLVRPNFVRPAHFERAADFRSGQAGEGLRDLQRVRATVQAAARLWPDGALAGHYRRFWPLWAEQLAYGFAHRLPHFAQTTSNVCLGGQLLDFGAMAAVPSWARVDAVLGGDPAGSEFECLSRCLLGHLPQMARHLDPALGQPAVQAELLGAITRTYAHALRVQMLRVLGLTRACAQRALAGPDGVALSHELLRMLRHCQRERFATYAGTPPLDAAWEAAAFWQDAAAQRVGLLRRGPGGRLGARPLGAARTRAQRALSRSDAGGDLRRAGAHAARRGLAGRRRRPPDPARSAGEPARWPPRDRGLSSAGIRPRPRRRVCTARRARDGPALGLAGVGSAGWRGGGGAGPRSAPPGPGGAGVRRSGTANGGGGAGAASGLSHPSDPGCGLVAASLARKTTGCPAGRLPGASVEPRIREMRGWRQRPSGRCIRYTTLTKKVYMRVISNVELAEVSGAGWIDDLMEALGIGGGSSSASSFTCSSNTVTNGSTTTITNSCSNGTSTVTVSTPTYTTTTVITPGTNVDGSIGAQARVVGGQVSVSYSAPPSVCVTTVMNGSTTSTCR